jgi:drug/metabolite transporter (DMT)-like permease
VTTLDSFPIVGIALAVLSALFLTLGNHLQSVGVERAFVHASRTGFARILALVRNPLWLLGSALFGVAILVQLGALVFAPLMVVQPVGVTALVFASLLTAAVTKRAPRWNEIVSIAVCVVSLGIFVTVAASVSAQRPITDAQLIAVLIVLMLVLAATFAWLAARRRRGIPPFTFVLLGGLFSGFVATLGKTVILRIQTALHDHDFRIDDTNLLTIACVAGIAVSGALSIWFVQTAHTVATPQVVVAGLTVVDPFVAVVLGITVLNEAVGAPWWSYVVFVVTGAAAMWGVWSLARAKTPDAVPEKPAPPL